MVVLKTLITPAGLLNQDLFCCEATVVTTALPLGVIFGTAQNNVQPPALTPDIQGVSISLMV